MLRINETNPGRTRHLTAFILLLSGLFILFYSKQANSFPFRALEIGKPIPDARFVGYKNGELKNIHSFAGKPLLLVFFGGDLAAKKKRAVKSLKIVQHMEPYLNEKGVVVLIVNMQNDSQNVVEEVTALSGTTLPIYKDVSMEAYSSFGVYVLPSFLLVDEKGQVSSGIGYSSDVAQRLLGEVNVMLGLESAKQLETELNPEVKELSKEKKLAMRHLQMGITMKHKGMDDAALRELTRALELDPSLHKARVESGCLYAQKGDLDSAIQELETALDGEPSVQAEICLAQVSAAMGEVDEAVMDLKALLFRNGRNPELHFTLGTFLEQQGKFAEAASSYRKAFELLQRKTLLHE